MKKLTKMLGFAVMLTLTSCSGNSKYEYPFQNPKLSIDERVENLLSLLTPQEKIGLMMNGSISIDSLGIPAYNWWSEACHGICINGATVYPQSIGLAATFDPDQQLEVYSTISDEARANWNTSDHNQFGKTRATGGAWHHGLSFWCPNINIFRDPRWGRGQETSGEDPYLSSVMGSATVKGMQGNNKKYYKTHACAKHYAVHSGPESSRHRFDVSVSMRDLWETYLPAFKTLVQEANVQEVMCAYNRYEGEPCCGSDRLLTDILRNKWGFKALVVSDCGAINNFYTKGQHETHPNAASASADAVLSGCDIECGTSYNALLQSIEQGLISEADIDVSLRRILRSRFELGMFDPEEMDPWKDLGAETISCDAHTELAKKTARETMVLLKNQNGILPLSKEIKKIAVVGPNADNAQVLFGNYNGTPTQSNTMSILGAIRQAIPNTEIVYDRACELADPYLTVNHITDVNNGKGLYAEFFNNPDMVGQPVTTGFYDQINMRTMGDYRFADNVEMNNFSVRLTGAFTADFTGIMSYSIRGNDKFKFTLNNKILAEQKEGMNGRRGGFGGFGGFGSQQQATEFKVVKGQTYKIEIDFSKGETGSAYLSFEMTQRKLAEYDQLVNRVKDVDAIIIVSGLSARLEGEEMNVHYDGFSGGDRTKIELPEVQINLIKAMKATGKPVVLVNCSGSAIGFADIEDQYDALIQAWYAGQAGGIAVADVLFGNYNPAGRLPITFYKSTSQLPDFEDYNMTNRTYRYFTGEAQYVFGYGLSYTTFHYGDATLSKKSIKAGKNVTITIPVTNTGSRDGDEVVQVYVKRLNDPEAPIKSLKGFKRVNIVAGETETVQIELDSKAFEAYDESIDELSVMPGKYQILYGPSSLDKDLKAIDFEVL